VQKGKFWPNLGLKCRMVHVEGIYRIYSIFEDWKEYFQKAVLIDSRETKEYRDERLSLFKNLNILRKFVLAKFGV